MVRPLRILRSGGLYHVMSRGDARSDIVHDDHDRQRRLDWLRTAVTRHGWRLHAFCLMTNHEHLFVETPEPNLPEGMKLLNQAYTQYFNARYRRCGHLLQGRYKAQLVEGQGYFAEVSRYIHLNPVRAASMEVKDPADYPWSSFAGYARAGRRLGWVHYTRVLKGFGPGDTAARGRRYAAFVRKGVKDPPPRPWLRPRGGAVIGGEAFFDAVKRELGLRPESREAAGRAAMVDRPELEAVVRACAEELDADREAWRPGRRSNGADRSLAAYVCRRVYGYPGVRVAEALGYRDGGGVTRSIERAEGSATLRNATRRLARAVRGRLG